jgi:hypothetical protein
MKLSRASIPLFIGGGGGLKFEMKTKRIENKKGF